MQEAEDLAFPGPFRTGCQKAVVPARSLGSLLGTHAAKWPIGLWGKGEPTGVDLRPQWVWKTGKHEPGNLKLHLPSPSHPPWSLGPCIFPCVISEVLPRDVNPLARGAESAKGSRPGKMGGVGSKRRGTVVPDTLQAPNAGNTRSLRPRRGAAGQGPCEGWGPGPRGPAQLTPAPPGLAAGAHMPAGR